MAWHSYQFTFGPVSNRGRNGPAIIDSAMPVAFSFVDRTFGGKGSSQGVDARTLWQVEMGFMQVTAASEIAILLEPARQIGPALSL